MAKTKNYAEDEKFAEQFCANLVAEWEILSSERKHRENRWIESYNAWSCDDEVSERRNYAGRANLKLPQLRKEIETMTRRLAKAMFPEDYLKADPMMNADFDMAVANTQVVRHYLDNVMNFKNKVTPWVKQGVICGTSPIRTYWHKEENEVLYRKRYFEEDELKQLIPKFRTVSEKVLLYNAPKVTVGDIFNTWVYPSTATDSSEIQRIYALTKVTYEQLVAKFKAGVAIDPKFLEDEGKELDVEFEKTQERMANIGESGMLFGKKNQKLYDLLEVWGRAEIDGKTIPYVVEIVNKIHPIRITQNPFWHQRPNFYFFRFIIPPGREFYGRGLPEATLSLAAMADDNLNQTMDSNTLALNSVTIVDPAFAPNVQSFEVEPNAIWWANPQGVKQFEFPDLSDTGIKTTQVLRSIITEMSDNQPQLPDPIAGKARSTGQAQLAINEWQTDLYSFVDQNIKDSLEPFAMDVHSLLQQNVSDDDIIRISGKYAGAWVNRVVTPEDLAGRYYFKWMGAITVENVAVKTQQMMQLLKIWPMLPPQAQMTLKFENFMIKLIRDGFNIRDVENIIESPKMNATIPPYIEDKILMKGGPVEVQPTDDDRLHIQQHQKTLAGAKDVYIRAMIKQHIQKHEAQENQKAQQMIQMQAMIAEQQMMQQQGLIEPEVTQRGRPPKDMMKKGPFNNPNGNQGQMSESTNEADLNRGLGV